MKYEKGPWEKKEGRRLGRILEKGFHELAAMPYTQFESEFGPHLPVEKLRMHAEGRVDFGASVDETLHMSLCETCATQMLHFERKHRANLKATQGEAIEISETAFTADATAAVAQYVALPHAERMIEILCCRLLRADLALRESNIVLVVSADDIAGLTKISVTDIDTQKPLKLMKITKQKTAEIHLGEIHALAGKNLLLRIEHEGEQFQKVLQVPATPTGPYIPR